MAEVQPLSLLGFDYGLRWIGVATGQTTTGTATPLTRLDAREGVPNWDLCVRAERFGRRLAGRFGAKVVFQDERLTTREAYDRMAGKPGREADHAIAAQVILEDWLRAQG